MFTEIRLRNFNANKVHASRCDDWSKLNDSELEYAWDFIADHSELDVHAYVQVINRLTIDDPRVRKSNRTRVWGLLLEAATAEVPKGPGMRRS